MFIKLHKIMSGKKGAAAAMNEIEPKVQSALDDLFLD